MWHVQMEPSHADVSSVAHGGDDALGEIEGEGKGRNLVSNDLLIVKE